MMEISQLTERENQVLRLLSQGLSNREIAVALTLSENTIKQHVAGIFQKLSVSSRTEAVATAVRRGLIALELEPLPTNHQPGR